MELEEGDSCPDCGVGRLKIDASGELYCPMNSCGWHEYEDDRDDDDYDDYDDEDL